MTTGAIASSSSQAYSSAAAAASAAAATNLPLPPLPPPKYSSSTAASSSSKAMSYQHEIEDLQGSLFVAAETIKDTEKKLKKLQATCFKLTKLTEEQAEQIRTLQLQAPHFQTVRDQNKCEDVQHVGRHAGEPPSHSVRNSQSGDGVWRDSCHCCCCCGRFLQARKIEIVVPRSSLFQGRGGGGGGSGGGGAEGGGGGVASFSHSVS
jgi:hypothetical protein